MRLQEQGVPFEEAYAHCLAEHGQEFLAASETSKASTELVNHDNLAEFASISQKGFARDPKELLVLAKWPDKITAFLVSWEQLRESQD